MILCIADILSAEALAALDAMMAEAEFCDGGQTAGWHARPVKRNEQAAATSATAQAGAIVEATLRENALFRTAVLPRWIRPVMFSRYRPGMAYGGHVDDAIMGDDDPVRTDVSVTVFLSDPASYEGGELVIDGPGGEDAYKLPVGSAVLYPATSLHRVAEVTRGERRAAVTWVQSLVRDAAQRELLFDLDTARRQIFDSAGKTGAFDLVSRSYVNLLRRWAEP